ncbi:MAG TPA: CvpA family protein [Azospirillaceae bacterium]|nr:CvpA family protein [Azospirillaceae bacterium]
MPINPVDAVVLAVLLLSALIAFARGFVLEVLSIFAWIGATFASLYAFAHVRPYAQQYLGAGLVADAVTVVGTFLAVLILLSVIGHRISSGLRGGALGALDRSLGFLFGLLRGGILICLVYMAGTWLVPVPEQPRWVREARTMPAIETGADWLAALAPGYDNRAQVEQQRQREARDRSFLRQMTTPQPAIPQPESRRQTAAPTVPPAPAPAPATTPTAVPAAVPAALPPAPPPVAAPVAPMAPAALAPATAPTRTGAGTAPTATTPASVPATSPTAGYRSQERNQLDQLIQSTR